MADKEYVIDNPDKPIYTSLYQPIPLYDEEGHPLTDDEGRHRCKLICVNGGASATTANVKAAILLAFTKNRVTIKEVQQELSDTASSLTSSIDNVKQEFTSSINTVKTDLTSNINNTKQEFTSSLESTRQELASSIDTAKADLTSSINTTKQELTSNINGVSSSLNTAKQDLSSNISNTKKEILDDVTTKISNVSKDVAGTYIKGLSVSGKTVTYTRGDGTTGTINTQDTNTTYNAGSNITLSGTTFSLTKANVVGALGYTPPTQDTNTTYSAGANITLIGTTFSLTKANVVGALGYTPPTQDTNTTYSAGSNLSLSGTRFNVSSTPTFNSVKVTNNSSNGILLGDYRIYVG